MSELIREDFMNDTVFASLVPMQQEDWQRIRELINRAIIAHFNIPTQVLGIDGYTVESTAVVLPDDELGQNCITS